VLKIIQTLKNKFYKFIENILFTNKVKNSFDSIYRINGEIALLASRNNSAHSNNLWDYEVRVYSQWGEDGILDYLTQKLNIFKPKILEIGVGDFTECNSRALVEYKNASAYLVDINETLETAINSSELNWKTHLRTETIWVRPTNINKIVENAKNFMNGIDIISLDIDGIDYWVMESMSIPEDVKIIIVEYNPIFGSQFELTVPLLDNFDRSKEHFSHLYFGCSLKAWITLFKNRQFEFIGSNRVGNNAFFINKEFSDALTVSSFNNLDIYTDWRIRESRDISGKLNYLSGNERLKEIFEVPIFELKTKSVKRLKEFLTIALVFVRGL
jgi:hypothetical protein